MSKKLETKIAEIDSFIDSLQRFQAQFPATCKDMIAKAKLDRAEAAQSIGKRK